MARRARAYTLLEILVVLAIISILMGIGVSVLSRMGRRNELEATTTALRALLRRARTASMEERWGAIVAVDPEKAEVRARLRSTITRFRFDAGSPAPAGTGPAPGGTPVVPANDGGSDAQDENAPPLVIPGAKSFEMTAERAEIVVARQGEGLGFIHDVAWAAIEDQPILSPREGIYVELYLYLGRLDDKLKDEKPRWDQDKVEGQYARAGEPHRPYPPRWVKYDLDDPPTFNIVRKGKAWGLAVTIDYELEVWVTGTDPAAGPSELTYVARTEPRTLLPERWYRLAFAFDGERARVLIDGIGRHAIPLERQDKLPLYLAADPAPLTVSDSHPDRSLFGVIDELVIATIVSSEKLKIPVDVALVASDSELAFDLLGQLDPARHAEPFVIWLSDDPQAHAAFAPAAPEKQEGTLTQAQAEALRAKNLGLGATPMARFQDVLPKLPAEKVKKLVVERTGLVR